MTEWCTQRREVNDAQHCRNQRSPPRPGSEAHRRGPLHRRPEAARDALRRYPPQPAPPYRRAERGRCRGPQTSGRPRRCHALRHQHPLSLRWWVGVGASRPGHEHPRHPRPLRGRRGGGGGRRRPRHGAGRAGANPRRIRRAAPLHDPGSCPVSRRHPHSPRRQPGPGRGDVAGAWQRSRRLRQRRRGAGGRLRDTHPFRRAAGTPRGPGVVE